MATPTTLPATFVAGNVLTAAQMNNLRGAFRVLQIVTATKTDTFSTSSTSFTDLTGMSLSITPSSTSSTILLTMDFGAVDVAAAALVQFQFVRGSTAIGIGAAAGSRTPSTIGIIPRAAASNYSAAATFMDSPATTSATTYKVQMRMSNSTGYINRDSTDADVSAAPRTICTLTAMEISA
jgi:hypothetical protein